MAVINAPRSTWADVSGVIPYYGFGIFDHLQNSWKIASSGPNEFVLHVFYAEGISAYPAMLTFRSETGFTYTGDSPFPTGVVSWVGKGFPGDGPGLPPDPAAYVGISGVASLGLSVHQIVTDPASLFAGDDIITGSMRTDAREGDEIYAGDGNDTIIGSIGAGWYDMGRGNGSLDAGEGRDFARFDLSDRTQAVVYTHSNTEASATVGGVVAVTLRNVERIEIIGGSGYDLITGGDDDDIINLGRGGGMADGGESDEDGDLDHVVMDFSDETRSISYVHDLILGRALAGEAVLAEVRRIEQVTITGGSGDDVLSGFDKDDVLIGGDGDDVLRGGVGRDVLTGGLGDDLLDGGIGYDVVQMTRAGRVDLRISGPQNTGEGMDTLIDIENVRGSRGDDHLIGNDDANRLDGGDGDDVIEGGGGDDLITGGLGNNILWGGDGDDRINGYEGGNILTVHDPRQGQNEIHGGAGNDIVFGSNGDDILYGDEGDDQLYSWGGQAQIYGGAGNDYAYGGDGDDFIDGSDGNDVLIGSRGDDVLMGGQGNDTLIGDGDSELVGGGGALPETTFNDRLDGGDGNDSLNGRQGDDVMVDASGDDVMDGGSGFDIVDYSGARGGVTVNAYARWDVYANYWARQDTGGAGSDILVSIEGIIGTRFDDRLTGRNDDWGNSQGQTFDEYFDGGAGDDVLSGESGADTLIGAGGNDTIYGGAGNDTIT
ncbi:MAG: calcium-binding protein, partial [Brevundimonas sp.]|nr:calcium-binding protein [Brevundimonas sp.]